MLRILYYLIRTWWTGERYYFVLLAPDRKRLYDAGREMSAPMIADGVNASIVRLIDNGNIRAQWSEDELEEIREAQAMFQKGQWDD